MTEADMTASIMAGSSADVHPRDVPILEMREVSVVRGRSRLLDRVTITLRTGEHTVILGPNGSGKSTLVKLIAGRIYPSTPSPVEPPIRIFGRDRWNLDDLRTRLGLVSAELEQGFLTGSSLGRATAIDLVTASFFGSAGVPFLHHEVTPETRERALAALNRVEVGHLARRRLNEVSTGEARRILIARALAHQPEVLLLDEPTTGLDLVARHAFLAMLRRLVDGQATLVLVTHHIEEVIPEVRRVLVMKNGRIIADGAPGEVLTARILTEAYGAPVQPVRREGGWRLRMEDHEPTTLRCEAARFNPEGERND
jgi:iron complex transport system ATP-binding protein